MLSAVLMGSESAATPSNSPANNQTIDLHCNFSKCMPAIGQQWAQFRVKYTGHARPVVSEALGLVALDAAAAAAALPLANRTPPPHPLSPSICRVTCVVPSVLC